MTNHLPSRQVLLLSALLSACAEPPPGTVDAVRDTAAHVVSSQKKIVPNAPDPTSACTALYSSAAARATLSSAVIDPAITHGATGTLILSFNDRNVLAAAETFVTGLLGVTRGSGLGVFQNLPMLAIETTLTPGLVNTLRAGLQPLGLLSIYQDRPLQYFLSESADFIGAPAARDEFLVTGRGIGVAIIDSGVDGTQGDFANLVQNVKIIAPIADVGVGGALYLENQANTDLTSGHGTHVASTIGGTGDRSGGLYTGIAPEAELVGIGAGDALFILFALQGFDYALDPDHRAEHGIRVISNSWGSSGRFAPFDPISIASRRAYDEGIVVTFAAGNEGPAEDTLNPYSASPCVISVAAGDKQGHLADFSSRGVPGDDLHHPDITAPGVDIIAARAATGAVTPPYTDDLTYGAFYSQISGTSMATPHLSGVIALMLEANPALNTDGVLDILAQAARPMYAPAEPGEPATEHAVWEVGHGYVDAFAAVEEAVARGGDRHVIETATLATWTGTVQLAVSLPTFGGLVAAQHEHTLQVPAGAVALRIATTWGNPAYDLDLSVFGPSGNLIATSAQGTSASEAVSIPNPVAGAYRVQLRGFLNLPTSYSGLAEIDTLVPLP
jgi:serine protease AprX